MQTVFPVLLVLPKGTPFSWGWVGVEGGRGAPLQVDLSNYALGQRAASGGRR